MRSTGLGFFVARLRVTPTALRIFTAAALVALLAGSAKAGFTVSGDAVKLEGASIPTSAKPGDSENDFYQVWAETSGTLTSNLVVDIGTQTGDFDGLTASKLTKTTLAAGTAYSSTFIHLDPVTMYPDVEPIATITFAHKIIGMALFGVSKNSAGTVINGSLDNSDIYGNPDTVYPNRLPTVLLQTRGIDYHNNDRFSISADGKTLSLQLTAGIIAIDQIRVFTAEAPEPASLVVWGVGLGALSFVHIRRRRAARRMHTCLIESGEVK